jgi:pyridinium-3,5-bisthiocarboxylic acid mononucleotide nickel chelatase
VRVAYLDCFSGVSGDMALAALLHAGADLDDVAAVLGKLPLQGVALQAEPTDVHGTEALRLHVDAPEQPVIRTYSNIRLLLEDADLPPDARRAAQRIYWLLANAAATVHGKEPDLVTFAEFGEADCLIEIVGVSVALELLGVERVFSSPVPTGLGMVRTEHGIQPIPSPTVLELLQGVPTYSRGIPAELVTPTGAAILAAVCEGYGDMPTMVAEHVGYGAGHLRMDFPHMLRVVIGDEVHLGMAGTDAHGDVLVEATVDELDEPGIERLVESLLAAGAYDAWVGPVIGRSARRRSNVSAVAPARMSERVSRVLSSAPGAATVRRSPLLTPG